MNNYLLLDSRAGFLSLNNKGEPNLNKLDEDWDRYIIVSGLADECCEDANNGEYGLLCVVATMEGRILWEWHASGEWKPTKK